MHRSYIKCSFFLILLFSINSSWAQSDLRGFWEPELEFNYDVTEGYSHNFSLASRYYAYDENRFTLRTRQWEIGHFSGFRIRGNQSFALGIMFRLRDSFEPDKSNELRLTEQYNITQTLRRFRLGHRFRTEQRIQNPYTEHRFRYRLALDVPLQGDELNIGEPYLVVNTESLLTVGKAFEPEYEQRLELVLGWWISKNVILETALEYRLDDFTARAQHEIFAGNSLSITF